MNIPKKYQRFQGVDPRDLFMAPAGNRKYICRRVCMSSKIILLTGPMEPVNAQKLIDDYRHYWFKKYGK